MIRSLISIVCVAYVECNATLILNSSWLKQISSQNSRHNVCSEQFERSDVLLPVKLHSAYDYINVCLRLYRTTEHTIKENEFGRNVKYSAYKSTIYKTIERSALTITRQVMLHSFRIVTSRIAILYRIKYGSSIYTFKIVFQPFLLLLEIFFSVWCKNVLWYIINSCLYAQFACFTKY